MKHLDENWKRGRPDIIHFALMEALATPLFIRGHLDVYVHTFGNKIISIADNLRLPKSYFRFEGIMQGLFRDGVVGSRGGEGDDDGAIPLLEIRKKERTLKELIDSTRPSKVVGLSSKGVLQSAEQVVRKNMGNFMKEAVYSSSNNNNSSDHKNRPHRNGNTCMFVVGGFPKGHFGDDVSALFDCTYAIEDIGLEAHVVIARILYECEKEMTRREV